MTGADTRAAPRRRHRRRHRAPTDWLRPRWRPPEPERLGTRLRRWWYNLYPCYFGSGARLLYMADDQREIHLRLPYSWRTRNLFGVIFGGSMFAAVDPVYVVMLMHNLGPDYVVWDREATIHFQRPGQKTLYARFTIRQDELDAIRAALERMRWVHRDYAVELVDFDGRVYATVEKKIYVRRRLPGEGR